MPAILDIKLRDKIVHVGSATVLKATIAGETSGSFYGDGVLLGAATNSSGNDWTLSWTPTTADPDVQITFVGALSGTSNPYKMIVTRANALPTTMSTGWAVNAQVAVRAGVNTPTGSACYEIKPYSASTGTLNIGKAASPANVIKNCVWEFWMCKPPAGIFPAIQFNFSGGGGYYNFDTGETTAGQCYITCVEKQIVDGNEWHRLWCRPTDSIAAINNTILIYMVRNFTGTTVTVSAGELANARIWICEPKVVGDVAVVLTPPQQMSWHINAAVTAALGVSNAVEVNYKHPFVDDETAMNGGAYPSVLPPIRVIKPTGWVKTNSYFGLVFLPPLSETNQGSDPKTWDVAAQGFADLYNAVVAVPYDRGQIYWWGERSTSPTRKSGRWLGEVLWPWLVENFSVSPNAVDRAYVGYSKSANAAMSQKLRYPTSVGFVVLGDGAWLNTRAQNQADQDYDTDALYNAADPKQIIAANVASVSAYKCITIQSGSAWPTDHASFVAQMTSLGVPFDVITPAFALHKWSTPSTNGNWTQIAVASMFAQRAAYLAPPNNAPKSSMFFM